MRISSTLILLCLLRAMSPSTWAQSSSQPANQSPLLKNSPIYVKNCARCHGKNGEGKHLFGGPSLISGNVRDLSADSATGIISNGKGRMPKFSGKLTPGQIEVLVRQIQALRSNDAQK